MPDLLIPGNIAHERAVNAAMEQQASFHMDEAKRWTEELKRIDPMLEVAWVPEQATEFDYPGRWHVRRVLPGDFDEWWPLITNAQDVAEGWARVVGEYKPPGAWIIEAFRASDMWNSRVHRSRDEAKTKHREAKRRAKELETEQRRDEMALANRAARRLRDDRGFKHSATAKRRGTGSGGGKRIILPPGVER